MLRIGEPQEPERVDRTKWYVAAVLLIIALAGLAFTATRLKLKAPAKPSFVSWETSRPFAVSGSNLAVRAEPSATSQALAELPEGTVAYGIGERRIPRDSTSRWVKVRTRSDIVGWCKAPCGEPLTLAQAEEFTLRDKQAFESLVRYTILNAAIEKIAELGLHGGNPPVDIQIAAPLTTSESSSGLEAPVRAVMHGAVLNSNMYDVDLTVHLFLKVNKDFLSTSTVEIQSVDLVRNQMSHGTTGAQAFGLFSKLMLF